MTVRSAFFDFDKVQHLTLPSEDGEMRDAVLRAVNSESDDLHSAPGSEAFARLVDWKLVWGRDTTVTTEENAFLGKKTSTSCDTLQGSFGDFDYAVIQRGDDCEIHLRRRRDEIDHPASMQAVTRALLDALAFLHGRNAWPQWQRIDGADDAVDEFVTAPRAVPYTIHTLLTERTCANGANPALLIRKAVECFLREDALSESLNHFLFLARAASAKKTPRDVGALGLCAVFEGLVGFLYSHFCVPVEVAGEVAFNQVKADLAQFSGERAEGCGTDAIMATAWRRFVGRIQSAHALRPADKFELVVKHFGLPWAKLSPALGAWKKTRNPLAHGTSPSFEFAEEAFAASRIAGAINVLAAAAIGYSGLAVLSRIEDQFIRLPESAT